jgi:hypothetical protein
MRLAGNMSQSMQKLFNHIINLRDDASDQHEAEEATALLGALWAIADAENASGIRPELDEWVREDEQNRYDNLSEYQKKVYNATARYDREED